MSATVATGPAPSDRLFRRVLTALALGVFTGLFLGEFVWPLKIVSDIYVKLLQITVLPYVLGSVIAGLGAQSPQDGKRLAVRGGVMLLLFWIAAFAIVIATSLAYPEGRSSAVFASDLPPAEPIDWIGLYIPSNVFHALAFNVLPAVVLFGILAGAALSGMSAAQKRPLLTVVEAFNEAMGRISRAIIVTTPLGLFAMSAAAAGAMRVEEFLRLQVWFVVYIGSACLISLWLLPALVALLTPVPYGRFVRTLQTAMLTAFAAGDYFVVLPMIAEANKQLLVEQGRSEEDADRTIGVVVPLLFNFPHTGKILSLAFVPFGAWFSNVDLSLGQWFSLATAGSLSMFGSINAAMPFLLDLVRLPADLFDLFTMSGVLNARFGSLVATMHTAALSMLVAASLLGVLRVSARRLVRLGVTSVIILGVFIGGTRMLFERVVPPQTAGMESLAGFHLREGTPAPVVRSTSAAEESPGPGSDRLDLITRRGILRVGFFTDAVPYAFFNTRQELVGYDIEMAFQLAASLGVSPEFVPIERSAMREALQSGLCDIVMSGVIVTVPTATEVDFSHGYHQERVGFLVPDHARAQFARMADVRSRPVRLGVLADRFTRAVSRLLPLATAVPTPLAEVMRTGEMPHVDAYFIPIDEARYVSRVQPRLAAVLPEDDNTHAVVAYAMPRDAMSLRNVVNSWVEVASAAGSFDAAYTYWVRGRALTPRGARWSIGSNVLGWW
jgi:Na+/H+-dicarboxylate symporter/ABC-type amino acid transport substrate-binding protein